MANQNLFNRNPFSTANRVRRGSTTKAPPKPPSTPPTAPNGVGRNDHLLRQLSQYQNMYKQTKNQLEVLKSQYRGIDKELNLYKSQKQAIDANHSNIVLWQKKIASLEMEKQTLMDKNGLFLQQKNTYLLQLADEQEDITEFKIQITNKNAEIEKLENEFLHSTQNYTQQLSKKNNKYKTLKNEYNSLNTQYIEKKEKNKLIFDQLTTVTAQFTEITQENLLTTDQLQKLQIEHNILKQETQQLQQQIYETKKDSSIAVQLAQKRDKNIIKDLRQTLKSESIKVQQIRGEYLQLKDELNDLRDWREIYLRQEKLQETQNNTGNEPGNADIGVVDNTSSASVTSSASNHTSTSLSLSSSKNSKNSITIKNKLKIMKNKSVTAIKNVELQLPSFHNLLSNEFGVVDDEKTRPNNNNNGHGDSYNIHDEVIKALSERLAIVKENYMNLKNVASGKDLEIGKLNFELAKMKEFSADLIEKLNDKPLPPTPMELSTLERKRKHTEKCELSDEDKVLSNLEEQGLCPAQMMRPPVPMQSAPSVPPPKVVVSPSYNKGIGHGYLMYGAGVGDDDDVKQNEVELRKMKKKYSYPKSYMSELDEDNESKALIGADGDGDGI